MWTDKTQQIVNIRLIIPIYEDSKKKFVLLNNTVMDISPQYSIR